MRFLLTLFISVMTQLSAFETLKQATTVGHFTVLGCVANFDLGGVPF